MKKKNLANFLSGNCKFGFFQDSRLVGSWLHCTARRGGDIFHKVCGRKLTILCHCNKKQKNDIFATLSSLRYLCPRIWRHKIAMSRHQVIATA